MENYNGLSDKEVKEIIDKEIKVLEYLKISHGIHFTKAHLGEMHVYEIGAIARNLEKRGFTSNNNGILDITEHGKEYLTKLLNPD